MVLLSEAGQGWGARNVQKCLKDAILIVRYNCEFYYLLGKNRKHKSKSFAPDVRTKCYGYPITIRDMCFECETLVSLPRWALDLICPIYVRLLYACSSQMGPRWSPISCLEESEECTGFLYFKASDFCNRESKRRAVAWNHQEEGKRRQRVRPCFPCYRCQLLFKVSVRMAEAVSWVYILKLTERAPPSHCHCPYVKCILLYVVCFPQLRLWGL